MTSIKRSGVQVNILDESTAHTNFDRLVSGIIGFIFLDTNDSLILSNIRQQIFQQLDDDQIGHNFIFLKNSIPISIKQEYLFNIQSIALSIQDLHPIEDELISDSGIMNCVKFMNVNSVPLSAILPHKMTRNLSETNIPSTAMNTHPTFEQLPHHVQYMGSNTPTMHILPESVFFSSPLQTQHATAHRNSYSESLSSCSSTSDHHKCLQSSPAHIKILHTLKQSPETFYSNNISSNDNPLSIFTIMIRTSKGEFNYDSGSMYITHEHESRHGRIFNAIDLQNGFEGDVKDDGLQKSTSTRVIVTPPPVSNIKIDEEGLYLNLEEADDNMTPNTEFTHADSLKSPVSTRLENQVGYRLPRIRANKSVIFSDTVLVDDAVSSILEQAEVVPETRQNISFVHLPSPIKPNVSDSRNMIDNIRENTTQIRWYGVTSEQRMIAGISEHDENENGSSDYTTYAVDAQSREQLPMIGNKTNTENTVTHGHIANQGSIFDEDDDDYFRLNSGTSLAVRNVSVVVSPIKVNKNMNIISENTPLDQKSKQYMMKEVNDELKEQFMYDNENDPIIVRQQIDCMFTVIGYPYMSTKPSGENVPVPQNLSKTKWIFQMPAELLKGMAGVQHSSRYPVWMDLVCDAMTFQLIAEHIRPVIHQLTIEDCITDKCREKIEIFDDYLFLCLRTTNKFDPYQTEKICILVFATMVITYHTGEHTINVINQCRKKLEARHLDKCPSPGWVCHAIIDHVIDVLMPEIQQRVCEVQNVEYLVFQLGNLSQNELLQRMQNARVWLTEYRGRLWPKSTITHQLSQNIEWRRKFMYDVHRPYWSDVNDHVSRMVDSLVMAQQTLEYCQNVFAAKVGLEMAQQSNKMSVVAGKVTAAGSLFLPLSFFAGLWGMNCKVPFQYSGGNGDDSMDDDYYGFVIVVVLMAVSCYITWRFVSKSEFVELLEKFT